MKKYFFYSFKIEISQCLNVNTAFPVIHEKPFVFLSETIFPEVYKAKIQK